jgi:phenylacetate-CoA ligase
MMPVEAALRNFGKGLYPHLPAVMQEALLSGYFYAKARRLYGSAFQHQLTALHESERFDHDRLLALQGAALRRIVEAAAHTRHYRHLFRQLGVDPAHIRTPADLSRVPILEKETLRRAPDDFVDERLDRRQLISMASSGSTGTPLRVYVAPEFEALEEAFLARQWGWVGFPVGGRRVKLRGDLIAAAAQHGAQPWRRNVANHELRMSSYHLSADTAAAYVERIQRFQPRALIAYPSSAAILAALVREQQLNCHIPLVFTSSETLSAAQRRLIEAALQARVVDHYGLTESVAAIQECERGSYHVISEYGIVELVPAAANGAGQICEIVATGLVNRAMPLLRYRTGDHVRVATASACSCGRAFPVVGEILGRADDTLRAASGALIGRLDHVFKGLDGILESQIVQEDDQQIRVRVVPGRGYSEAVAATLLRNLHERLGDLPVDIELVDMIPRGPNGKFRAVVGNVSQFSPSVDPGHECPG